MTRYRGSFLVAAVAAAGGIGMAATQASAAGSSRGDVLKVANVKVAIGTTDKAHKLLVDAKGRPVYLLTGDSSRHPKCASSSCLTYWPAVTTSAKKPMVGAGVKGKVGVWRHNHINQVTLNGHPLYTFAQDSAGSALGEGVKSFGGTWEVMTASGSPMAKSSKKSSGGGSGW